MPPNPVRRIPELTDAGNAERFADQHRHHVRWCPAFRSWLTYDGKRWTVDRDLKVELLAIATARSWPDELHAWRDVEGFEELAKAINKHTKRGQSSGSLKSMLELARAQPHMRVHPEQLDANPWLLNCDSGTIDLRTGKVKSHKASDLCSKLAPVKYDGKAQSAVWNSFLANVTGGDLEFADFLQRSAGYFLTGVNSEKCFFLAHSERSDTGKSTYLDSLKAAMGDYAMTASPTTWIEQPNQGVANRGDLARLLGARLVTASEFREDARFDESLIKSVTGGDEITVSEKYEKNFTYRPQFKLLLASNFAPRFSGSDEGMIRRTRRMPFINVAKNLDPSVRETLIDPSKSGQAILAWMVAGCIDWQRNGLPTPPIVKKSNEEYQRENDSAIGFFEDCLEFNEDKSFFRISKREMRDIYEEWCKQQRIKYPLGPIKIASRLRHANCEEVTVRGERFWTGCRKKRTLGVHDDLYERSN